MLLWSGQAVSSTGGMMTDLALPLLVLALTHSPAQAGLVATAYAVPYLVFALPAGALADRWNRKKVMILCDLGRAIVFAAIPIAIALGHLSLALIYVVAAAGGTLFVFFNVCEAAALPRVVPREQLHAATAQNQIIEPVSSLLGPPIAGLLFQIGRGIPFLVDSVSYGLSVISLSFIRTRFQGERPVSRSALIADIRQGLAWLLGHKLIRFLAFLTGGNNLVFSGGFLAAIVLAQHLHASAFAIGAIFSLGAVGGFLGALVSIPVQRRLTFGQALVAVSWAAAAVFPLMAVAPNVIALGVVMGGLFFLNPVYNVVQFTYRAAIIPDELQGRVNSVFRLVAFGGQPIGTALAGLLLQKVGPQPTVLILAAVLIVLAVLTTLNRVVRHAPRLDMK
jgi:MFS family permease